MSRDRRWMYDDWSATGPNANWCKNAQDFVNLAFSRPNARSEGVHCPCNKCGNFKKQDEYNLSHHIVKNGFVPNYFVWTYHGETAPPSLDEEFDDRDHLNDMLHDLADASRDEEASTEAEEFYKLLEASENPVHDQTKETTLSAVTRLINFKAQFNVSAAGYNTLMNLICDLLPENSVIPKNFNESKKLLNSLGMPYEKIDVCYNGCMLFRKEHKDKITCDKCNEPRYHQRDSSGSNKHLKPIARKVLRYLPIIPRLKRLFMSEEIAKYMSSHKTSYSDKPGVMMHPSDGDAWKHFDKEFPEFADELRNVRLGLCTDGFTPFSFKAAPYSCWPVFLVPYNLPPSMCMKKENIFLTLVIPGPQHPGKNWDVYMEPLYDDLKLLWDGVQVYDRSVQSTFKLRACYFYSIHDLPALGMVSGHSTHGKFACPVCLGTVSAFWLVNGYKYCWFDCHRQFLPMDHPFRKSWKAFRKRTQVHTPIPPHLTGEEVHQQVNSLVPNVGKGNNAFVGFGKTHNWTHISGLWQLPYFDKLLIRHNIDVMHNEKNMAEALLVTCMDFSDRTKDNVKARLDLASICDRPQYHLCEKSNGGWDKPRALYCLSREQKIAVLEWLKGLKFPDMFAANIRRGVKLSELKIIGLKSHDYHIFMERLLPVAFRGFLDNNVWLTLAELSFFYRQLCSKELEIEKVKKLEENIPVLICKLEKIFPPGFFNPMQHLMIHLPYEARVGGPVQYRWMYPFERLMKYLKNMVKNKARVEGCIVEAYILEEISNIVSLYFKRDAPSSRTKRPRYDDGYETHNNNCSLSTFQVPGRGHGKRGTKVLTRDEYHAIMIYIYTNTLEMDDFVMRFDKAECRNFHRATQQQIDKTRKSGASRGRLNLFEWFRDLCLKEGGIHKDLVQISHGCRTRVSCLTGYDVNNFRFRSEKYEKSRPSLTTTNSGVFLSCSEDSSTIDYYGVIEDIIEVNFEGTQQFNLVLFECRWFHPINGIRKSPNIGLTEVNPNTKLPGYEPFVLPHQCKQVYYTPYPCCTGDLRNWWVVHHVPKCGDLEAPIVAPTGDDEDDDHEAPSSIFYQEDTSTGNFVIDLAADFDLTAAVTDVDEVHDNSDIELLNKRHPSDTIESNEPPPNDMYYEMDYAPDEVDQEDLYDDPDDF